MKMNYRILSCLVFIFFFVACDEEEEIQAWIQKMEQLKISAQEERDHTPYGQQQQEALKAYFSEINQGVIALQNNRKLREPFNSVVEGNNAQDLCSKVFLIKSDWQTMVRYCTRNRFFLCSEEVRSYPEILLAFRSYLNTKNQNQFDATPACMDSL